MRSLENRHLCGAFLGGTLGIVFCGLISPGWLAAGCFLGVVFGFAYDQLWRCAKSAWRASLIWRGTCGGRYQIWKKRQLIPAWKTFCLVLVAIGYICWYICFPVAVAIIIVLGARILLCIALFAVVFCVLRYYYQQVRWFQQWYSVDPTRHVALVRAGARICYVLLQAVWIVPTALFVYMSDMLPGPMDLTLSCCNWLLVIAGFFTLILSGLPLATCPVTRQEERPQAVLHGYFTRWEQYSHEGPGRFFLRELDQLLTDQYHFVIKFGLYRAAYGFMGFLHFLGLTIPFDVVVLMVKGMVKILRQPDLHLCAISTLAVTSTSAFICQAYLRGSTLWLVALVTGIAAGYIILVVKKLANSHSWIAQWAHQLAAVSLGPYNTGKFNNYLQRLDTIQFPGFRPV